MESQLNLSSRPESTNFEHSVDLIPTPGVESRRPRRYEPLLLKWRIILYITCLMIGIALALEVTLAISDKKQGFSVPPKNAFSFLYTQFITTFFPTLFIAPLTILWDSSDQKLRWYQPYVALANGHSSAEESLLLDYVMLNKPLRLVRSFRCRHWLVFISGMTVLATILVQPLAGSVFEIRQTPSTKPGNVTSIQRVGLAPATSQLTSFLAAAGYAGSAVFNGLLDPPFIMGGWSTAEFTFPTDRGLNASMTVNTVGIQTSVNCALPSTITLNTLTTGNNLIQSTSAQGCSSTVTFNSSSSEQQYGVVPATNCGSQTSVDFETVMFWFFQTNAQGQPEARGVFCQPTIGIYNIKATANLNNGSLASVTMLSGYTQSNNVTGTPTYNGVVFDTSSSDPFVQARAMAINSEIPGAIMHSATQQPNGLRAVFDDSNGFLDIINRVYKQHLAFSAKSVYFVPDNQTLPTQMTSLVPKLFVQRFAAHALSVTLLAIALTGLFVHNSHKHARRNLWLTARPGSIAASVALTSRSGFGELLLPYDDRATMSRKLTGLRFYLDQRTGAILADDDWDDKYTRMDPDDPKMSLLDGSRQDPSHKT